MEMTAPALVLASLVVLCLVIVWLMRRPKNLPPGPGLLSFMRSGLGSGRGLEIYERFGELAQRFGPIFSVRLGPILIVVLSDGRSIRQALVDNGKHVHDHFVPGAITAYIPKHYRNAHIGFSNGKVWSDLTRFCVPVLRSFGFGKKSLEPSISGEATCLCDEIKKHKGSAFNFAKISTKATGNVICQLVFGRRYDYDDNDLCDVLDAMNLFVRCSTPANPSFFFPWLMRTPLYAKERNAYRHLEDFIFDQFRLHRQTFQKDNIRDLIDAYIADDISKDFVPEEFWRTILDFFAGGTETAASFISWTVLYMAAYPDIQRKVQDELDTVVGHGRQPTLDDRARLPLCDATVMEILRCRPILPLSLAYLPSKDVSVGGYNVPRGTIVIPCIWASHHNPREWEDPEEFCPERFLEEDGKTVKKNSNFIPFGIGRRECMGSQLAKMETFLFFANVLQRFKLSFPQDQPPQTMKGAPGLTLWPEPFEIMAEER